MSGRLSEVEAVVLRTLRYGEADVIAHVFTRHEGRRGVIAKGGRRPKSRLGGRLEPFTVLDLQLAHGRGDLATVRSVTVRSAHETLRSSYLHQQVAAAALHTLGQMSVEHSANEPAYHLTCNLLHVLDEVDPAAEAVADVVNRLLLAYHLKLLHVTGLAPVLGACVRCRAESPLGAFSAADGGMVCDTCREAADVPVETAVHAAAAWAIRQPLATVVGERSTGDDDAPPPDPLVRAAMRLLVTPMCAMHAGFRPRPLPGA